MKKRNYKAERAACKIRLLEKELSALHHFLSLVLLCSACSVCAAEARKLFLKAYK